MTKSSRGLGRNRFCLLRSCHTDLAQIRFELGLSIMFFSFRFFCCGRFRMAWIETDTVEFRIIGYDARPVAFKAVNVCLMKIALPPARKKSTIREENHRCK